MQTRRFVLVLASLALAGLVVAQTALPSPDPDPRSWFTDVAALAAIVFAFTALAKERFDTHDLVTLAISYATGIVLAVGGSFTPIFDATLPQAVMYGFAASTLASGGRDGVLAILWRYITFRRSAESVTPAVAADANAPSGANPLPPSRKG